VAFPLRQFLADNPDVAARIRAIQSISSEVRTSQYFLTRACNIRCKGCWFFTYGLDKQADDEKDLGEIDRFLESERARGITTALLVGGEPTLVPKKVERFVRALPFVTVTTNGWRPLPVAGFENVAVAVSLFAATNRTTPSGRFGRMATRSPGCSKPLWAITTTTAARRSSMP
jgi:hypothetical protein